MLSTTTYEYNNFLIFSYLSNINIMTNRFAKRNNCLLVLELSKVSLRLDKKENFRLGKAV